MKLDIDTTTSYQISHYATGLIRVNDRDYREPILITATTIISPWPVNDLAELREPELEQILRLNPEIIIFGSGPSPLLPSPYLMAWFGQRGIGIEIMESGSACRTFNLLASEGRQVVAGLLLP